MRTCHRPLWAPLTVVSLLVGGPLVPALAAPNERPAGTLEKSLAALRAVDKQGAGHEEAQRAMQSLAAADAADLPAILKAFDGASPLASNWLRNLVETVADRNLQLKRPLPAAELEAFVRETSHNPRGRRLAYEWLVKIDPTAPARLIPGMLLDPAAEFRHDAVALRMGEAAKVDAARDKPQALKLYREALSGALDDDQVKTIAQALTKLGEKVDISKHFAFLTQYSVIGPFDNRGGLGLEAVYPPEKEIQLDAAYDGQIGKVSWQPLQSRGDYGMVDIAKQVKPYKGAVMYLLTGFQSPISRRVELRLGTDNAWKLWLNGELQFSRNEYHRGKSLDQYRIPVTMKPGNNVILLKLCQNEQTEDWAQDYQVQLRVCDSNGLGIRSGEAAVAGGR
ncbi:MAG TPA: hypothetical protein VGP76_28765 [Planctomycetaceae bacterium]|nr:hypothetical protein [Planctomycetaceae bacterium]